MRITWGFVEATRISSSWKALCRLRIMDCSWGTGTSAGNRGDFWSRDAIVKKASWSCVQISLDSYPSISVAEMPIKAWQIKAMLALTPKGRYGGSGRSYVRRRLGFGDECCPRMNRMYPIWNSRSSKDMLWRSSAWVKVLRAVTDHHNRLSDCRTKLLSQSLSQR